MSLTVLADENIPALEHYLGELATVRNFSGRKLRAEQLAGVDVLLVRSVTRVDETLLRDSGVKFVGTATSGVDHIDQNCLRDRGIGFSHAPGANANSVVEYVLAAIAAVDDKLEQLLDGGTVGIVGYGMIGKAMVARLQALGVHYRVYDPWLDQATVSNPASLAQVLECEVVTLHAELTRELPWPSFHLLGAEELAQVPSATLLINASRGPVVDNRALQHLLAERTGPAVVLDVWEGEPALDHSLLQRVALGTAHIAGYSLDGKLLATRMLCQALASYLGLEWRAGESPVISPETLVPAGSLTNAQLLRALLQARYDIRQDDALLREATLARSPHEAAAGFDRLRRSYRQRRELSGSAVDTGSLSQQDIELLHALGCTTIPTAAPS